MGSAAHTYIKPSLIRFFAHFPWARKGPHIQNNQFHYKFNIDFGGPWCILGSSPITLFIVRRREQHCPLEACSTLQGVATLPPCSGFHLHRCLWECFSFSKCVRF